MRCSRDNWRVSIEELRFRHCGVAFGTETEMGHQSRPKMDVARAIFGIILATPFVESCPFDCLNEPFGAPVIQCFMYVKGFVSCPRCHSYTSQIASGSLIGASHQSSTSRYSREKELCTLKRLPLTAHTKLNRWSQKPYFSFTHPDWSAIRP